ncbi:MAG: 4'-phosphopantetheinyl transferase superfamily protein [Planctomycetes bacterium]|nr:4'-phosphopantetheinyl transferase superfamily protein [Planctomycetota bacterium]
MTRVLVVFEPVAAAATGPERVAEQSAAARRALARAAAELGLAPLGLSKSELGAPRVDRPGWWVSLAHTRTLALAVLADRPVGADLEDLRSQRLTKLRRFFEPDELARLGSFEPRDLAELWSAKEAVLKLAGAGLEALGQVVLVGRESGKLVIAHRTVRRSVLHRELDSHLVALCVDADVFDVEWRDAGMRVEERP